VTARYSTTMDQHTTRSSRALGSNYVLEREIGGGATGRVWRAVRRADGAQVAVKILRAEFAGDTDSVVRILRQRTVLAEVRHPNLVRVHDLVAEGGQLAVVMDLVEGRDLRQVIREMPLGRHDTLTILAQVALALTAVHAAGVVHRDIKPENVLIQWHGDRPHAMLTDFGLAKFLDSPVWTSASVLHGTPAYLSPEVVTGKPAGPEADVYALSIMAYELLAGQRPVQADNPAALLLAHLGAEVSRPPGLTDGLWRLISAGLAKEPKARPTAAEFAANILDPDGTTPEGATPDGKTPDGNTPDRNTPDRNTPVLGSASFGHPGRELATASTMDAIRPAPLKPKPPKPKRGRRWILWTAGALCLVLGVGAGLWAGRPDNGPAKQSPPSTPPQQPIFYYLPVTATSPKVGEVQLKFLDAGDIPGFESYIVFRDELVIEQITVGRTTSYTYLTADHTTEFCYKVAALLQIEKPPPGPRIEPACLAADGKLKG
jgi:serine/threonine protein kinase